MKQAHVLIIGAAGMIGQKLANSIAGKEGLGDIEVTRLTLVDVVKPAVPPAFPGKTEANIVDISAEDQIRDLIAQKPDIIFHLAAIVSSEAEDDLSRGYQINLDGTRHLLEAIRQESLNAPYKPRLIFTSSLAVFGSPLPDVINDDFALTPLTSYGTQKAICELLLSDYSRRGIVDGIGIRLPTICIRPGRPNKAASGFFSSILREPLIGQEAVLPVPESVRHWFASPRTATGFLIHAATIQLQDLGSRRNINMPGISATVGDQIAALRRVAGERAVRLIRHTEDPSVLRIIENWPRDFDARRARAVGFEAEASFDAIIREHIDDELGGNIGDR